jgi:transcriptional regulator GlxA family with amidase domain
VRDDLDVDNADRSDRPHHVVVVLYDGVHALDVAGPMEVFATANTLGADYRLTLVSLTGTDISTASGFRLGVQGAVASAPARIDTLIVPGGLNWSTVAGADELIAAVKALDRRSGRTVSVCAGTFLLAATGVLDQRRVVAHWETARQLASQFPDVRVDSTDLFATDGKYVTSAGVAAAIDLSLALVEHDHTAALSADVARRLVVFVARPGRQAQLSVRMRTRGSEKLSLRPVLDAIDADPRADHSVAALATRAGLSSRHLNRLFVRELATTPMRYVDRVRLEAACTLLLTTAHTVETVADRCGIGSSESLRRLFRRELGVTPSQFRRDPVGIGSADEFLSA